MKNSFVKSHGLGNDYIVMDANHIEFELDTTTIQSLCDRNYGVGSDGILLLTGSKEGSFSLKIFNPDGSEAEKSGNGLRIFSKFLYEHGYTTDKTITIDTPSGKVHSYVETDEKGRVRFVTVEMGKVTFKSEEIPVEGPTREVVGEELRINGEIFNFTAVSIGNPHCVIFREELDEAFVKKIGPIIENHPLFPNRINVQFAKVIDENTVEALIWERGAGYTLASGSSSCAIAAASVKNGFSQQNVTVSMPGGTLEITVESDWSVKMRGEVQEVFTGQISNDFIAY